MSDLVEAVVALKHGYEVEEKCMYDDDMIGHAETLTTSHEALIEALAKAAAFDKLVPTLNQAHAQLLVDEAAQQKAAILATQQTKPARKL